MKLAPNILSKCLKGSELACKSLYEQYLPYCYGICIRYGVNNNDIKDQIQVIFSSTFKSLHNFDETKASFKTWFTHICINKILEQRRINSRQLNFKSILETKIDSGYNTSHYIDGSMDQEYMLRILNKMPPKFQSVFNMFVIDGYTHKEIAKALDISEGSSRILLKRGRDWAKTALTNFLQTS